MGRLARFLNTFRRARLDREIDDEVAFHVEMRAREHEQRGLAPADARREALRQVGSPLTVRDRTRDTDVFVHLETMWLDARHAVRALFRAPSFALAATFTLALGIGANTAMFAVVYGVLLQPLPFPEPDRLYTLFQSRQTMERTRAAPLDFLDWQAQTRTFTAMAAHTGTGFTLTGGGDAELIIGQLVSAELFEVLGVRARFGRTFRLDENEAGRHQVLVLGHGLWTRRFGGDPDVIGRTVPINGKPFTVVGVMPPGFAYPSTRYELWAPFPFRGANTDNLPVNRASRYLQVIARLRPGVTPDHARSDLNAVALRLAGEFPETHRDRGIGIASLLDETVGDVRLALWLVFGAATLVLLIACTNVTSLLLARFSVRERELGVRTALGASRGRIVRQIAVEMLVLYAIAAGMGLVLAVGLLRGLVVLAPTLPRLQDVALLGPVLAFTFLVTLSAAAAFGVVPAWHAARTSGAGVGAPLGSRGATSGRRQQRARTAALVAQVALAVVLVVGAGLTVRSLLNLERVPKGFDPASVVTFDLSLPAGRFPEATAIHGFYDRLLETLGGGGRVEAVGVTTHLPLTGQDLENSFRIGGYVPEPHATPVAGLRGISPGYLAAMGIPLRRGRHFIDADRPGTPPVVLINESFARRYFPDTDPLGGQLSMGESDPWRTVVGVVADVKHRGLASDARPEVLMPFTQLEPGILTSFMRGLSVVVRSDATAAATLAAARQAVRQVDVAVPVIAPREMTDVVAESIGQPRFRAWLFSGFGVLALILTLVGTFGLMSYVVAQRRREFGIRIALGATPSEVRRGVVLHGLRVIGAGLALGAAGAIAATRAMQAVLYGVRSNDVVTLALAIGLLTLTGLAACYWPARRATRVSPIEVLRAD